MVVSLLLLLAPAPQAAPLTEAVVEAVHRARPDAVGGWTLVNPTHDMAGRLSEEGLELGGSGWSVRVALSAWGRANDLIPAGPARPAAEGTRVELVREGITEWYLNRPRGLEQGFTVETRPCGAGPLRLELAICAGWRAEVSSGGRDARLLNGEGAALHYLGLQAFDAEGRELSASLSAGAGGLAIDVDDAGAAYPVAIDPWLGTEIAVLAADDGASRDYFGNAVALDGDTLVVGASGVAPPAFAKPGSAYVFYRDHGGPGAWGQVTKLVAGSPAPEAAFGSAVAVDGDTIVVGAPGAGNFYTGVGRSYVFERDAGGPDAWGEVKELVGDLGIGDSFGCSVSIDADTVAVGAKLEDASFSREGAAYLFERDAGGPENWGRTHRLPNPDPANNDFFGYCVAVEGDMLVVGVPGDDITFSGQGSACVFERNGGLWSEVQRITASDGNVSTAFGQRLDMDGDNLLVGCPSATNTYTSAGAAYVFERAGGTWAETQKLLPSVFGEFYDFGVVALSGDKALIGAPGQAAAFLFQRRTSGGSAWVETQMLTYVTPWAGLGIALDGTLSAVGSPYQSYGTQIGDVIGAAFDTSTGTLYGAALVWNASGSSLVNTLVTIDTTTGVATPVGPTGFSVHGLAYDPGSDTLYGVNFNPATLLIIDRSTGAASSVGPIAYNNVRSLAFDPGAGVLYAFADKPNLLIRIDPATANATPVGPLPNVRSLAFDANTNTLYGAELDTDELVIVDQATAALTVVGKLFAANMDGLAFDPGAPTLFGTDRTNGALFDVDVATGAGQKIGEMSTYVYEAGVVHLYSLAFETETYCTAGVSASGCQASIGSSGTASATAPSGFSLQVTGIEGQKDGLFFYGINGRQANPWGNGTSYVCVIPPRSRGGLLTGTGTAGECDGVFSQDLNARWCPTCPKPQHNPGAGALVQAQMWYRDPQNTSNQTSSMSNAIEFQVGP